MHAFVFTDVLVHVCMQEQIHTDACTWRPRVNTALPRLLSPCVLRLGLSLKRLSRLADRGSPGDAPDSTSPVFQLPAGKAMPGFFHMGSGDKIQVLMFARWALH